MKNAHTVLPVSPNSGLVKSITPAMANGIDIHNKYKDKNFTVLGIPTNDKPENSKKIIADMKVPYPQMLNAQAAGAMTYGINSIPYLILFSPDGTIIARGNTIENLEEILSKL